MPHLQLGRHGPGLGPGTRAHGARKWHVVAGELPLLGVVAAGVPIEAIEHSVEALAEPLHLPRGPHQIEAAIEGHDPSIVLVDTSFPEKRGFEAIGQVLAIG